jgi:hypothetical protein
MMPPELGQFALSCIWHFVLVAIRCVKALIGIVSWALSVDAAIGSLAVLYVFHRAVLYIGAPPFPAPQTVEGAVGSDHNARDSPASSGGREPDLLEEFFAEEEDNDDTFYPQTTQGFEEIAAEETREDLAHDNKQRDATAVGVKRIELRWEFSH